MKHLIYLLTGIVFITFMSFSSSATISKPAKPVSTIVFSTTYYADDCVKLIKYYVKLGYTVKTVSGTSQYGRDWIVVMEKY